MAALTVVATLDALGPIGAFVMDAAREAGLAVRAANRLRLAVDELATNIIVHGQPLDHSGDDRIRFTSDIDEKRLTITMEDRGPYFDPRAHALPLDQLSKPLEERPIGGLGVFLAVRSVDGFDYSRVGDINRCTFVVNRTPAEGAR